MLVSSWQQRFLSSTPVVSETADSTDKGIIVPPHMLRNWGSTWRETPLTNWLAIGVLISNPSIMRQPTYRTY